MSFLVTGAAGFIGFHAAKALLERGDAVIGIDNLNAYYDVGLKKARLALLERFRNFTFHRLDIAALEEGLGGVKADEAGRACDEKAHILQPVILR